MPRGVKGSGKAATAKRTKKTEVPVIEETSTKTSGTKVRKAYPTCDERIVMVDKQIERLEKLNSSRADLIEKTETTLNERKIALDKSTLALEKALAKKERLLELKNKPAKAPSVKLTPEEKKARIAAGRAAKKAELNEYTELRSMLKEKGMSMTDLFNELKNKAE